MQKLVQRWQKRLWLYAHRLAGDPEAAWDITQETWLAIIRGLRKLQDPAKFKQWAYRIVTNKAMDLLKARQPTQTLPEEPTKDTAAHDNKDSTLSELLGRLNPSKRAVLALYYLEGLTTAQVASVLDIPKGTVKSRLHSARNELRKLWQQDLG